MTHGHVRGWRAHAASTMSAWDTVRLTPDGESHAAWVTVTGVGIFGDSMNVYGVVEGRSVKIMGLSVNAMIDFAA